MEQQAALIQAIGGLIGVIVWPIVVVIAVFVFRDAVKGLLGRDEVSLKGPAGFAITASRRRAAAEELVAATSEKGQGRLAEADATDDARDLAAAVRELGRRPRALWVDDRPSNNRAERSALERLGLVVDLSTATDAALGAIARRGPYDLIISDMARGAEPRAGLQLLDRLRADGDDTPFVIYAASRTAEDFDEAVRHGALGTTNRPSELVRMVAGALRAAAAPGR